MSAQAKTHPLYSDRRERKSIASVEHVSRERVNTGLPESANTTPLSLPIYDTKTRSHPPPAYSGR